MPASEKYFLGIALRWHKSQTRTGISDIHAANVSGRTLDEKDFSCWCHIACVGMAAWAQDVPKVEIPIGFSMINVHPNLTPSPVLTSSEEAGRSTSTSDRVGASRPISWVIPKGAACGRGLLDTGYTVTGSVAGQHVHLHVRPTVKKHSGTSPAFRRVSVRCRAHQRLRYHLMTKVKVDQWQQQQ